MRENNRQHNTLYKLFRSSMVFGLVLGMCTFHSNANAVTMEYSTSGGNLVIPKIGSNQLLTSDNLKIGFFDTEIIYLKSNGSDDNVEFVLDMHNITGSDITHLGLRFENVNPSTIPDELEGLFNFPGATSTHDVVNLNSNIGGDYIELWYENDPGLEEYFSMDLKFDWYGFELANPNQGFNLNIGINNPNLNLSSSPVPVPPAVWLFSTAMAGLFLKRRKL